MKSTVCRRSLRGGRRVLVKASGALAHGVSSSCLLCKPHNMSGWKKRVRLKGLRSTKNALILRSAWT